LASALVVAVRKAQQGRPLDRGCPKSRRRNRQNARRSSVATRITSGNKALKARYFDRVKDSKRAGFVAAIAGYVDHHLFDSIYSVRPARAAQIIVKPKCSVMGVGFSRDFAELRDNLRRRFAYDLGGYFGADSTHQQRGNIACRFSIDRNHLVELSQASPTTKNLGDGGDSRLVLMYSSSGRYSAP
jgi:hypothetical protein